jgi:hypothetical protein
MDAATTPSRSRAEQCKAIAQAKSAKKRAAVMAALADMRREGQVINKSSVARRAGVSVVFIRSHADLCDSIERTSNLSIQAEASDSGKAKEQLNSHFGQTVRTRVFSASAFIRITTLNWSSSVPIADRALYQSQIVSVSLTTR